MITESLALILGLLLAAVPARAYIGFLKRWGYRQHVRDDGPTSHLSKAGTPTMGGGLLVGGGLVAGLLVAALLGELSWAYALAFLLTVAYGALGAADDLLMVRRGRSLGLKARHKLLFQFVLAGLFLWALYWAYQPSGNLYHPFGRSLLQLGAWYPPLAALFLVGTANAVNLTDGLDGLASGLAAVALVCLGVMALRSAEGAVAIFCFALAGGCLGFLWSNAHPARIFMGDTGSLALGAALAGVSILLSREALLVCFGLIFYLEAASVILQVISYQATRRRIFRMSPLHHHFELSGWPETQVVVRFWVVGAAIALLALSLAR